VGLFCTQTPGHGPQGDAANRRPYTDGHHKTCPEITMNTPVPADELAAPLTADDFEALEDILDDLRERGDDVPQWEFCEGAIAALLCTRRLIMPSEYFPVLLGTGDADGDGNSFRDEEQFTRFTTLWTRRWNEVARALGENVEALDDERTYEPEVMDVRGAVASLPEDARADIGDEPLPAFGQVWALGFMFVVENWPEEWAPPRDKEAASILDEALGTIVTLTEDDTAEPTVSMHAEDGPPSVSQQRLEDFGAAIWAVYDLRELWQSLGPRVQTVRRTETPGRNDPCWCGSGKKFKKCHME
jgi:uncharacterized protein